MSRSPSQREVQLRLQIDDLKRQRDEKHAKHAELQQAIARFPPRDELELAQQEVHRNVEATKVELQHVIEQMEPLRAPEENAFQLCLRLHRLEGYCDQAEAWVEQVLKPNIEEDIARENSNAESEILALVESLQQRRDDAVEKLIVMKERIRQRAADLRRGYHREPVKKDAGAFDPLTLTMPVGVERSVSPRAADNEDLDDETVELTAANTQLGDEISGLQGRLRRLQKLRSRYHSEIVHFKQDSKKEMLSLENSILQVERAIARDQRLIQQLHASNGALTSTLQMLMAQLNVEHYGTQVGPMAIAHAAKRQEAIMERQQLRSASQQPTASQQSAA